MTLAGVQRTAGRIGAAGLGVPVLLALLLGMLVIPLPPVVLDLLFTFNIALSLVVLLAVVYSARPLDLAVFPTVLLLATLLRLGLNVASTRVVLLEGHTGTGAAGKVIESFGSFVIGGSYAVGLVVFAILVIINFVVVTKGAGRVSEVSARFTLDAMPGKQMAIDADLNAGILGQDEARARRREVAEEADFYGAMDGASKFVRGDAIAGILILFINLLGGLAIGTLQHGLGFGQAVEHYALLTIGDGLVAQIPSLLLSSAAAVLVTRVSTAQDMGGQILSQLAPKPRVLWVTAGILALVGVVPGMPNAAFLLLAGVAGGGAWWLERRRLEAQAPAPATQALPAVEREIAWEDVAGVDPLGLEVGYRLVPLVDKTQGGPLLGRIRSVRRKASQELGFLVHPVHIRDNLDLAPTAYRISVNGASVAEAQVHPERDLAINPGEVFGPLEGEAGRDPVFGLPSVWIDPAARDRAQSLGYTVVDAATVVATHLNHVVQEHAHHILGHQETQHLLDHLGRGAPRMVEELVPKTLPLAVVTRVLQNLLREGVPVRDLRTIVGTLAEIGPSSQDPDVLTSLVRVRLGRFIVQQINGLKDELPVITLDADLDRILHQSVRASADGNPLLEPGLAERLQRSLAEAVRRQEDAEEPAVLLVSDALRGALARFARQAVSGVRVLAFSEVPEAQRVRIVATVGGSPALA